MDIKQEEKNSGMVRRELYAYLATLGIEITDEVHDKIKKYVKDHSMFDNEELRNKVINLGNALRGIEVTQNKQTIIDWVESFRCPVCGMEMIKRKDMTYVTDCSHMSGISFSYA